MLFAQSECVRWAMGGACCATFSQSCLFVVTLQSAAHMFSSPRVVPLVAGVDKVHDLGSLSDYEKEGLKVGPVA